MIAEMIETFAEIIEDLKHYDRRKEFKMTTIGFWSAGFAILGLL